MTFWQFITQNRLQILSLTAEHLRIVGISIFLAAVVGIPLGILISRRPFLDKPVLGIANIIQTMPSLALFGFLLPVPWIGALDVGGESTRPGSEPVPTDSPFSPSLFTHFCHSFAIPIPALKELIVPSSKPRAAWA